MDQVWRKSSYSESAGDCVEARVEHGTVYVRDTKDRTGPVLAFSVEAWRQFLACIPTMRES